MRGENSSVFSLTSIALDRQTLPFLKVKSLFQGTGGHIVSCRHSSPFKHMSSN